MRWQPRQLHKKSKAVQVAIRIIFIFSVAFLAALRAADASPFQVSKGGREYAVAFDTMDHLIGLRIDFPGVVEISGIALRRRDGVLLQQWIYENKEVTLK